MDSTGLLAALISGSCSMEVASLLILLAIRAIDVSGVDTKMAFLLFLLGRGGS